MSASRKSVEDEVLDLNSLKTFTIPKKKKTKKDLFEPVALDSREFQHEILPIIEKNFKDRDATSSFKYQSAKLVHNYSLTETYLQRRKEMRSNGYSDKEVQDSYAFLLCDGSRSQTAKLCESGVKIGNTSASVLGNPDMGVSLCRHPDLISPIPLPGGRTLDLVIFKIIKGKVKSMVENRGGVPLDPTPNCDSHISKSSSGLDLATSSLQYAYQSTQIYLYEYDEDIELVPKPRQICPFAVVEFRYSGEQRTVRPLLLKQISPKVQPTSTIPSPNSFRPALLPTPGSSPLLPTPGSSPVLTSPGNIPPLLNTGSLPRQRPTQSPIPKHPSQPPGLDPSLSQRPISKQGSSEKQNETSSVPEKDYMNPVNPRDKAAMSSHVGHSVGDNGVVVWTGHLCSKGVNLCGAELVTYGEPIKPSRIGVDLSVDKLLTLQAANNRYFSGLSAFNRDEDLCHKGRHFVYGELRPRKDGQAKFNQLMTFLRHKSSVFLVQSVEDVDVLIMTNCELTQNLGKGRRTPNITGYIPQTSPADARLTPSPALEGRLTPSPGSVVRFTPPLKSPSPAPAPGGLGSAHVVNKDLVSQAFLGQTVQGFTPPRLNSPSPTPWGFGSPHVVNKDLVSHAFLGQTMQAVTTASYEMGPPSVGSHHSHDSWSLPPSPSVFSSPGPSPTSVIHNIDDLHATTPLFKDPPSITRLMSGENQQVEEEEVNFEEGYQKYVPVESLIYRNALQKSFDGQTLQQDKFNIETARRKFGPGNVVMGPPPCRPPSRGGDSSPSSSMGSSRKRTPSLDSGSSAMSPFVASVTPVRTPGSDSYPSPAGSYGEMVGNGPNPQTPPTPTVKPPVIIGPHGQHIEPISPAGSGGMETPGQLSPQHNYDPLEQLQQQLHQKMSPIKSSHAAATGSPQSMMNQSPSRSHVSVSRSSTDFSQQQMAFIRSGAPLMQATTQYSLQNQNYRQQQLPPSTLPPRMQHLQQQALAMSPIQQLSPLHSPQTPYPQYYSPGTISVGQSPQGSWSTGQIPSPSDPRRILNDPRLTRRLSGTQRSPSGPLLESPGISPASSASILENILVNKGPQGVPHTPPQGQLSTANNPFISRSPHPTTQPSPVMAGVSPRDPRLGGGGGLTPATPSPFSLDGSQNLQKSLSVTSTNTPSTPGTVISSQEQASKVVTTTTSTNSSTSTSINLMLSLLQTLSGSPALSASRLTTNTSTSSSSAMSNSSSSTTLAAGDITPCQTERLTAETDTTKVVTSPALRQGTIKPETEDDEDKLLYGSFSPEPEEKNKNSDSISDTSKIKQDTTDELPEIDEDVIKLPFTPSLSNVAKLAEDFESITSGSGSASKVRKEHEDISLSDDLINLIVRSQPLANKAARELKKQIRDIEEQSKKMEKKIHSSEKSDKESKGGKTMKTLTSVSDIPLPKPPKTGDPGKRKTAENIRKSSDSETERGQGDARPPSKRVRLTESLDKDSNHKTIHSTKESRTTDSIAGKLPVVIMPPKDDLITDVMPVLGAGGDSNRLKNDVKQSESPSLESPSEELVSKNALATPVKEIPTEITDDINSDKNKHSKHSLSKKYENELDYFSKLFDKSSNSDLLALGLDYVSVRFLGGARVQKKNKDLSVHIDVKGHKVTNLSSEPDDIDKVLKQSINKTIHKLPTGVGPVVDSPGDRDRELFWHITLHYILPVIEEPDEDSRVVEGLSKENRKPQEESEDTGDSAELDSNKVKKTDGKSFVDQQPVCVSKPPPVSTEPPLSNSVQQPVCVSKPLPVSTEPPISNSVQTKNHASYNIDSSDLDLFDKIYVHEPEPGSIDNHVSLTSQKESRSQIAEFLSESMSSCGMSPSGDDWLKGITKLKKLKNKTSDKKVRKYSTKQDEYTVKSSDITKMKLTVRKRKPSQQKPTEDNAFILRNIDLKDKTKSDIDALLPQHLRPYVKLQRISSKKIKRLSSSRVTKKKEDLSKCKASKKKSESRHVVIVSKSNGNSSKDQTKEIQKKKVDSQCDDSEKKKMILQDDKIIESWFEPQTHKSSKHRPKFKVLSEYKAPDLPEASPNTDKSSIKDKIQSVVHVKKSQTSTDQSNKLSTPSSESVQHTDRSKSDPRRSQTKSCDLSRRHRTYSSNTASSTTSSKGKINSSSKSSTKRPSSASSHRDNRRRRSASPRKGAILNAALKAVFKNTPVKRHVQIKSISNNSATSQSSLKSSQESYKDDRSQRPSKETHRYKDSSHPGRERSGSRYHPYKRPAKIRVEEQEKEEIFKIYRSYRNLEDLMQCLTAHNFESRQTRPLSNIFTGPFPRREQPRFRGYHFRRHSIDDLAKARGLRGDDLEDKTYTSEEVTDFHTRKKNSEQLDSRLFKTNSDSKHLNSRFNLERSVYGDVKDENENRTSDKNEKTRHSSASSSSTATATITQPSQSVQSRER